MLSLQRYSMFATLVLYLNLSFLHYTGGQRRNLLFSSCLLETKMKGNATMPKMETFGGRGKLDLPTYELPSRGPNPFALEYSRQ